MGDSKNRIWLLLLSVFVHSENKISVCVYLQHTMSLFIYMGLAFTAVQ
jgi:hypothetical protein